MSAPDAPVPPAPSPRPDVSVVVPAMNEAKNLPELARRVHAAMAGRAYELIVVDDGSRDGTPAVCADLARAYPLTLVVREKPEDGLSGAVLRGFAAARGQTLAVMDADLQHPPEKLPELLAAVEGGPAGEPGPGGGPEGAGPPPRAEFAIGSRYVAGGSTAEQWGPFRRLNSWIATVLARPFAGRTADPMSGFFALRRTTFERGDRLTPLGYKIGLELMCKCRVEGVAEVPIHFDARAQGESKLTLAQQFKYLEHLSRLYDFCYPRLSPIVKFLIATVLGWGVGLGAYHLMVGRDVRPGVAIPAAYLAAIASTLVFHARYVRTQRRFLLTRTPWRDFVIVALGEFAACTGAAIYLLGRGWPIHWLELFALTFGVATVARYVLRKELMQDIRGLRRDLRVQEVAGPADKLGC
jgi:dolichol-phosphate mannosyltransferase